MASFPHEHSRELGRPRLEHARADQIARVYRESWALWGAGLRLADYHGLWEDLHRTPWGRRHARFRVWTAGDGSEVLSSLKVYRPRLRIGDAVGRATVLGAIFTPPELRGRGHASAMVDAVLADARIAGDLIALLFTDIGTGYYGTFGFEALPAQEQWGVLSRPGSRATSGWTSHPLEESDLPDVMRAHRASSDARRLAIVRDEEHWEFLRVRSERFFERLGDSELRQRWIVVRRHGSFAGYLITVEGRGEWNVREVAAASGEAEDIGDVLRAGAALAWTAGLRGFYAWLPPSVALSIRDLGVRSRTRPRAQPMILPLVPGLPLAEITTPEHGFIPFQDQF